MDKPIKHSDVVQTLMSAAEAVETVVDQFGSDGLTVTRESPTSASGHGGSRLSMRLWGVLGPSGGAKVPFTFRVRADPSDGGSAVDVEMASNEGRYLFRVDSLLEPAYEKRFEDLVSSVRTATGSVHCSIRIRDSA